MGASGLGSLLVKEGFLTEQDRLTITKTCGQGSWAFAKSILAIGLLDEDELAAFFAERTKYVVAPKDFLNHLDLVAARVLDKRMISKLEILPMRLDADKLTIGVLDPLDRSTIKQLEFFTGLMVEPIIVPLSQLYEGILRVDPDFLPRHTSLSQFLQNHVGAAWVKQRIITGEDFNDTGATPSPSSSAGSMVSNDAFDDDDGVEEIDDMGDDGVEAVEDDASFAFKDDSEEEEDDASMDSEDDPFAGTKSTEAVDDDNDDFKVIMPDDPLEDDSNDDFKVIMPDDPIEDDSNDDFKVIMPDDPLESDTAGGDDLVVEDDDSPLDADDLAMTFNPKGASKAAEPKKAKKQEITPAIDLNDEALADDFGMDDLAADGVSDEDSLGDDFSAPEAVDDQPPRVDDDAIFDALDDDSPSLETKADPNDTIDEDEFDSLESAGSLDGDPDDLEVDSSIDDEEPSMEAMDDDEEKPKLESLDSLDDDMHGLDASGGLEDFAADDFGGGDLKDELSASGEASEFGMDEETNVKIHTKPKGKGPSVFDDDEETAINLRPSASKKGPVKSPDISIPKASPDERRDPGLSPTAILNEALLRLSLSFDADAVDAVLKDTLPRMGASGCLIKAGGSIHSWANGKGLSEKVSKAALENLTKKSQEGKWQKLALKKPESWTTQDLSLSVYRTGKWIWAHEAGNESEIFIEAVESLVNQLQGK